MGDRANRLSHWFWRLLQGRSAAVDAKRRNSVVRAAGTHQQRLRELTDEQLTEAAAELRRTDRADYSDADLALFLALAREGSRRTLDLDPFDVQLLSATWLLSGQVVQMATGEGKTLSGAIAAIGYALRGWTVHVASVNDYLARRDAEWMGPLYRLFGVGVGWITSSSTPQERRPAYAEDVTYAPVSELGFDLLRDRTVTEVAELVAPEPGVVLVDEADSVLVDEARVPLVLAGSVDEGSADRDLAAVVRLLRAGMHYETDDEARNVYLTGAGAEAVERALGGIDLYSAEHVGSTLPAVNVALHAEVLLTKDVDYLVREGKVQLINHGRGRVARLQRWPDGLQAAVEAKEALPASATGEVLDTITVQSLIKHYPKVCGMTGTALAASDQLRDFYQLRVAEIPPNEPCVRVDEPDRVYATVEAKNKAVVAEIAAAHATGRPVLVGTPDVAESEQLAARLAELDVPCVVLNAKNDAEEAAIIAEAGAHGAVTVSTQMAGRGTDIRLGGADGADRDRVVELGGLYVIGTSRHYTSRLDDQLRGRSGRQGDPGGSVFFSSMDGELVTRHAPDAPAPTKVDADGLVTDKGARHTIDHAQRVAEATNLEVHANTWRYNQLTAEHRRILGERRDALLRTDLAARELAERCPERHAAVLEAVGEQVLEDAARQIALHHLDRCWAEHLAMLADLREGIHLWALSRESPIAEFHRAAIPAFKELLGEADRRTEESFLEVKITDSGAELGAAGLRRPNATWTYLVHENPFGSDLERTMRGVGKILKGAL
ncbi:accessory Sec system translocase SecA2 [Kutzneria viridogrisea]|uniref:Protein translocase subunit SecA n=2 Tax=Kutzneria TaxID=43356 RepID=W5W2G7_9PSEU|nr:accessory Sec system translocase SecA2 [Kutzneria albida]AHH94676.1 Protein translocase subunit secA 2 [Kutzneria albida DSM 43870]MBA8930344.1 preprotein translocase subunit SecA [Kutzneria viridogrisea]